MDLNELTDDDRKELLAGHVPKDRFDEATGKLQKKNDALSNDLANLQGQVSSLQQNQNQPANDTAAPVDYTRAQLRKFVENDKLTQDESDQIWDRQVELKFDKKLAGAMATVGNDTNEKLSTQGLVGKIDEYMKILPDLNEDGSDNRTKVSDEYAALSRILGAAKKGSDKDLRLQLSALERSFGTAEKLKGKVKSGNEDHENMESLGAGDRDSADDAPKTGALKGLSADQKTYYRKGIEQGRYKDWAAVTAELEYKRKGT